MQLHFFLNSKIICSPQLQREQAAYTRAMKYGVDLRPSSLYLQGKTFGKPHFSFHPHPAVTASNDKHRPSELHKCCVVYRGPHNIHRYFGMDGFRSLWGKVYLEGFLRP